MKFVWVDSLTKEMEQSLYNWGHDVFKLEWLGVEWRKKDKYLLAYEEDELIGCQGILTHQIVVGTTKLNVGGLGGLSVIPKKTVSPLGARLVNLAMNELRNSNQLNVFVGFSPFYLLKYYERMRWYECKYSVLINQEKGSFYCPIPMIYSHNLQIDPIKAQVVLNSAPW